MNIKYWKFFRYTYTYNIHVMCNLCIWKANIGNLVLEYLDIFELKYNLHNHTYVTCIT